MQANLARRPDLVEVEVDDVGRHTGEAIPVLDRVGELVGQLKLDAIARVGSEHERLDWNARQQTPAGVEICRIDVDQRGRIVERSGISGEGSGPRVIHQRAARQRRRGDRGDVELPDWRRPRANVVEVLLIVDARRPRGIVGQRQQVLLRVPVGPHQAPISGPLAVVAGAHAVEMIFDGGPGAWPSISEGSQELEVFGDSHVGCGPPAGFRLGRLLQPFDAVDRVHVTFLMGTDDHANLDVVPLIGPEHRCERIGAAQASGQGRIEVRLAVQLRDRSLHWRPVCERKITRLSGSLLQRTAAPIQDAQRDRLVAVVDRERADVLAGDGLRAWQRHTARAHLRLGP